VIVPSDSPIPLPYPKASIIASYTAGRTCLICFERPSGQVRFVNSVIESSRSETIQSEVPVYPRCPKDCAEKYFPDCEGDDGVSQPSVLDEPSGDFSRVVNNLMVSGLKIGLPPRKIHCA